MRGKDRRENWRFGGKRGGSGRLALDRLAIGDAVITYRDAVQHRDFTVRLAADAKKGVRIAGSGSIAGDPVMLAAQAPPVAAAGRAWPFKAAITGDAVGMTIRGTMDRPLDFAHMDLDLTTHADDLKLVDAIIEAGLFGTQPVRLAAHARRDGDVLDHHWPPRHDRAIGYRRACHREEGRWADEAGRRDDVNRARFR